MIHLRFKGLHVRRRRPKTIAEVTARRGGATTLEEAEVRRWTRTEMVASNECGAGGGIDDGYSREYRMVLADRGNGWPEWTSWRTSIPTKHEVRSFVGSVSAPRYSRVWVECRTVSSPQRVSWDQLP